MIGKDKSKAFVELFAVIIANIVVTRIALGAIVWASWGWQWGIGTVLACWLSTKLAISAIETYLLEEREKNDH